MTDTDHGDTGRSNHDNGAHPKRVPFSTRHPLATYVIQGVAGFAVVASLLTGWKSYVKVDTGSWALKDHMGAVIPDILCPGLHGKEPWLESITEFPNGVLRPEITAGGKNGNTLNTLDRQPLKADLRIHFRIDPKVGLISLYLTTMSDPDSRNKLLQEFADDSVDLLAAQKPVLDTLSDPQAFLKGFGYYLSLRFGQNNVPVRWDMIELLRMSAGGLVKNVQMRLMPDGSVVQVPIGPGAAPVPLAPSVPPADPSFAVCGR